MVSTKFHYSRVFCRRLILLFPGKTCPSLLISPNLGPTPLFRWKSSSFCFADYVGWSFLVPFHVSGWTFFDWFHTFLLLNPIFLDELLCFPFFAIHHHSFFFSSVSNHHRAHFRHQLPKQTFKCSHPFLAAFLQILHFSQVSPSSPLENARSYPSFLHNAHHFSSISHPIPHKCPAFSLHFLACFHISSSQKKRAPPGRGVVVLRGAAQLPDGAQKLCLGGVPVDATGVENAFGLLEKFLSENVYS